MKNLKLETNKQIKEFYSQPLDEILRDVRMDERRCRAMAMAARLDSLSTRIISRQLTYVEAAELLREEAIKIQNAAQELH